MMKIPKSFKIAGQKITVIVEDSLPNNDYGYYCDATNEIHLAKTIKVEEETVTLKESQVFNTFWHEVIHVFQFYFDNTFNETQAQVYANFMNEFFKSLKND